MTPKQLSIELDNNPDLCATLQDLLRVTHKHLGRKVYVRSVRFESGHTYPLHEPLVGTVTQIHIDDLMNHDYDSTHAKWCPMWNVHLHNVPKALRVHISGHVYIDGCSVYRTIWQRIKAFMDMMIGEPHPKYEPILPMDVANCLATCASVDLADDDGTSAVGERDSD
jgi:hypothetical protein